MYKLLDAGCSLSIRRQCALLSLNRSRYYYKPLGESAGNLKIMRLMDAHILEEPTAGVLTMQGMLRDSGIRAGHERVRRLMRKANIHAIYPRRSLTQLAQGRQVHPYLLRGLEIGHKNHVWEIDITYVPMAKGFLYMTGIIDVYSRYIVGWGVGNSLDAQESLRVVEAAVLEHGPPEIINSDQGPQFTCPGYVGYLKSNDIRISMDGKGRALDNIYIERFWRTIKYQHIYLHAAENGHGLYRGIEKWLRRYHSRGHQGIGMEKPAERYFAERATTD